MNKSMLIGVVAGIGVATAGGVAGYSFLNQPRVEQGSALASDEPATATQETAVARAEEPAAASAPRSQSAAPRPTSAPRPAASRPAAHPAAAPAEHCWDEEVTVQEDPKDGHQIAGTALGAAVGGAIGKDVGDRNLTTAAGAAAGAFIGRKLQQKIQENHAQARTTTKVVHHCEPGGTPQ